MNPPTEAAAAPKGKPKRSNGITTPSRRGGSGRVLTDVIVDLVETGETLRQNGLEVFEQVVDISSVVIANVAAFKLQREPIRRLLEALAEQPLGS